MPEFANQPALAAYVGATVTVSWAASTLNGYSTGEKLFARYGLVNNLYSIQLYPPSAPRLIHFAGYAAKNFLKSQGTINSAMTALRAQCISLGHDISPFSDEYLRQLLKGLRTVRRSRKRPLRLPLTIWALARLLPVINIDSTDEFFQFAATIVGFHALLRGGEFLDKSPHGATLLRRHITLRQKSFTLHLVRSKTDTYDEGITLTVQASGGPLCPFTWVAAALARAPNQHPDSPLFQNSKGLALTYISFQSFLNRVCVLAKLGPGYKTHSLRIGMATTLIELGFPADLVQQMGRWLSDSYQFYVRISDDHHIRAATALAKAAEDRTAPVFCGLSAESLAKFNSTNIGTFAPTIRRRHNVSKK